MAKHFTVQLPTKPFLAKYIQSFYGSPVVFSSDDYFGMLLAACLQKNVHRDRSAEEIRYKYFDLLDSPLTILFPASWLVNYYHGTGIKPEKALFITKIFEERFEEDLHRFVSLRVDMGKERKKSIELFAKEYGLEIDVDITYDNLKQTEYRFRKKKEKKRKNNPLELSREKAA